MVAAADYPLTGGIAPGEPNIDDVSNQPRDVSFLIDSILAPAGAEKPFSEEIDSSRIGIMSASLYRFLTSLIIFAYASRV